MNDIKSNIDDGRLITLVKIDYDAGDYKNYKDSVDLHAKDNFEITELDENGFTIQFARKIESTNDETFFSILVAFDVGFSFSIPFDKGNNTVDKKSISELVLQDPELFTSGCMSKISLIISEISMQFDSSVPIVTPPNLIIEDESDNRT